MHHHYKDIRDRIAEPPKWFDEEAVPRYCDFSPNQKASIYADEVALVLIACQVCERRFKVALSRSSFHSCPTIEAYIRDGSLHYGDPPNVECCPAGATMNCDDLKVLEYWRLNRQGGYEWERVPELEVVLDASLYVKGEENDA